MNYFLKYSLFIVIILITYVSSVACGEDYDNEYFNIKYQPLLEINVHAHLSENKENNNNSCKRDTIENDINFGANIKLSIKDGPDVDFTFTNDSSCAGTSIQFTSNVTGTEPFTYTWNFGDGQTSIAKDPTHTFKALGCETQSFTVTLTVSTDTLSDSKSKNITVIQKPDISFFDKDAKIGEDDFDNCGIGTISDPNFLITVDVDPASPSKNCIESYSIDWGDGSSKTDATFPIDHDFTKLGAFNMVITAVGSNGCENSFLYVVKNQSNPSTGINSPGTTTDLCTPTDDLEFTISSWGTNSPGTTYLVDYGDGTQVAVTQEKMVASSYYNTTDPALSTNYPVPHSYTTSNCPDNTFKVTIYVENACGVTDGNVGGITIITKPKPDFSASATCVNSSILFTNKTINGSGKNCMSISNFTWDFGDGSPIVEQEETLPRDITHIYTTSGVYNVTLTAINNTNCGGNSITKQITISDPPTATISGGANVCLGDTPPSITFTGADSNPPYTFTYKINNGPNKTVTTSGSNNSITIQAPTNMAGTFTYSLISVSASSCSQSQTGTAVIIVNSAQTANITGTVELCLNDPEPDVTFTGANGTAPYTFTYNINGGTNKTVTTTTGDTVSIKAPTNTDGVYKYNLTGVKDAGSGNCSMTLTGSATITINEKPPPPVPLSDLEFCKGEITSLISFSNNVSGSTFEWINSNTAIGIASSGTGNIQPFTARNSSTSSINSTVTVIASIKGCKSESTTFTITVYPSASVTSSEPDQTICSGETTTKVLLSSTTPGADLSWITEQPTGISESISLSGTNTIESETLTNVTNTPISIVYNAKATVSGTTKCSGVEYNYTITVNPKLVVSHNYKDTICSGASFDISPKDGGGNVIPTGTKYTWSKPVINPVGSITGSSGQDVPQTSISQTLLNTNSVIGTAKYTVTPLIGNCKEASFEITIYVIPGAAIDPIGDTILCSGDINEEIDLGSPPEGTKFKWLTDNINIGLPSSSGYDKIPEFIATNNDASSLVANITVEAESVGESDCGVVPVLFTITVNPRPKVSHNYKDTICSGASFDISPKDGGGNVIPTGTKYTWSKPVINPVGSITGSSGQDVPQTSISQTLLNTSTFIATVTYRVTPATNSCTGASFDIIVYVIPGATLLPVSDITLCGQEINEEIDFGNPPEGIVYKWITDNKDVGLPEFSGIGNILAFTAVNNGTFPIIATITVTPEGDFGGSDCGGIPIKFTITVNPIGQVDNPGDYSVCSGQNISINFTTKNTVGTTKYEWINSNVNIGIEASGSGDISFDAINIGDTVMIAIITVTPIFVHNGDSCTGVPEQFTITIIPVSTVDQPVVQNVCNGNKTAEVIFSGKIPNTIYNWSINDTTIGFPANGTGDIPEIEVTNTLSDSIVAIITVVPSFNGCEGTLKDFKIIVYPSAIILKQPSSSTICFGEKPVTLSVEHTTGVKKPTYQWYSNTTNSTIGGTLIPGETNNKYAPPSLYTNTTFYFCFITFSDGGCGNLVTDIAKVAINPNPIVILNNEQISEGEELKFCEGDTIFVHATGAETYIWNAGTVGDSISIYNIGDYRAIGISQNGCMDTFNLSASYFDLMYYFIQSDKNEITNDQNKLHLWSENISPSYYSWDFGDGETGSGYDVTHIYDVSQDGYFEVKLQIINPHGCIEEATKKIWTSIETISNTFTPNGDGINDFYLDGWNKKIYNRNGILLYEGEDGWDGNYKGKPVANDTYFVVIYDSSEFGANPKTNYVTVLR